jgi:hypothetical protein
MSVVGREKAARYPRATVLFYGPDDLRASRLLAEIYPAPGQISDRRDWRNDRTDVREDSKITAEVTAFLKERGVVETVVADRIAGCPHEEGIDYPPGGVCFECSFWWNAGQRRPPPAAETAEIGRNDPCHCGSGRKLKKCCGAAV